MTSARCSRADIREILNNATLCAILPCGYNDLRAVRSATSEKMPSAFFLCGSIPTQSLCSGRCLSAIQVEPSISSKCFKSLPLRKPPARGRVQTWRNTLRPDIGNHIEQPGSVAKARDRPLLHIELISEGIQRFSIRSTHSDVPCAWPILRSCPSGVGLSAPYSSLAIAFIFSFGGRLPQTLPSQFSGMRGNRLAACGARTIRSPSLISVVVCLVVESLAVYGVAIAEERSYPIRHRRHCTCYISKHRQSGSTASAFVRLHLRFGEQPCCGGEPLCVS